MCTHARIGNRMAPKKFPSMNGIFCTLKGELWCSQLLYILLHSAMQYIELGYNLQSKLARALNAQTSPPHQRGDVVPDSVPKLRALAHPQPQLSARTPVHFSPKKSKLLSPNFSSFPSKNHDIFIKPTFFRTSIVVLKANCQHL